jgi:hypothetical protein
LDLLKRTSASVEMVFYLVSAMDKNHGNDAKKRVLIAPTWNSRLAKSTFPVAANYLSTELAREK